MEGHLKLSQLTLAVRIDGSTTRGSHGGGHIVAYRVGAQQWTPRCRGLDSCRHRHIGSIGIAYTQRLFLPVRVHTRFCQFKIFQSVKRYPNKYTERGRGRGRALHLLLVRHIFGGEHSIQSAILYIAKCGALCGCLTVCRHCQFLHLHLIVLLTCILQKVKGRTAAILKSS